MTALLRRFFPDQMLEKRVLQAQKGDEHARNQLIGEYTPFIRKHLSKQLGRFIEEENDDALSVGLIAFNDAIDRYEKSRGPFLPFAGTVIRNRLIDHIRKTNQSVDIMPVSALIHEEGTEEEVWRQGAWQPDLQDQAVMAEEMNQFINRLSQLGITLDDLVANAPRHKDTRQTAVSTAYWLYGREPLRQKILEQGRMPLQEIHEHLGLTKKTVDRSKKLIIAIMVVLDSDLETMKQYVEDMMKEGSK